MNLLSRFSLSEASQLLPEETARLGRIPILNAEQWAELMQKSVNAGEAKTTLVHYNGEKIGCIVWRIENNVTRELVIMSAACDRVEIPVTAFLAQAVDQIAAAQKCESARIHTCRPALVKHAHKHGWQTTEIVVSKSYV